MAEAGADGPVLVTGGTGTLGRVLVARLRAAGVPTRVLSRRPGPGRMVGDLRDGSGIEEAVRGAAAVVHLATAPRGDAATTATLVAAMRRAAIPHLLHLSIVGIEQIPLGYYRGKLAAERVVTAGEVPYTLQRATQFHDLLAAVFRGGARTGVLPVLAGTSVQPIDTGDVADRLVALLAGPPAGRVDDLGGPEVAPMAELGRQWLAATGRRRIVLPLRLPGAIAAGYRAGAHLTPGHAVGTVTFAQYLAGTSAVAR